MTPRMNMRTKCEEGMSMRSQVIYRKRKRYIHTYIHTYRHTYRQTNQQTDRHVQSNMPSIIRRGAELYNYFGS